MCGALVLAYLTLTPLYPQVRLNIISRLLCTNASMLRYQRFAVI
jgi:hypothetical protein